jgi:hypothetical protein
MEIEKKIVGIMQPYFFPYFEQFRLIDSCDLWVVFDTVQFSRKSWITRNRILNRDKGTSYVSVAVRHTGLGTSIKDAQIEQSRDWRAVIMDRIKIYQTEAPNYAVVRDFIGDTLQANHQTVAELNTAILVAVCRYLGISTPILVASSLSLDMPGQCEPGEWALHISKNLGASEYRNAAGGKSLFDPVLYAENGIELSFHVPRPRAYRTGSFSFVEDLSVIDWMMWNDRELLQGWLA